MVGRLLPDALGKKQSKTFNEISLKCIEESFDIITLVNGANVDKGVATLMSPGAFGHDIIFAHY
jgi:hypothetical protein